jgi:DNA-binding transcriptional LysR family regulator
MTNNIHKHDFSLDDLYVFAKTAEIGTFANAAKLFSVSNTTIGRKVTNLENDLGVKLIEKTNNSFHLTPIGQKVSHILKESKVGIHELKSLIQDCIFNDVVSGDLTIAIPPSIGVQLISKKIPQFMRENPLLKLNICYQNKIPELLKDNIDIAITPHFPIKSLNQKVKKIGSYPIKLFCTKQYQQKYGVPNTPDELVDHQVVGIMTDYLVVSKIRTFEHAISKETYEVEMPNFITSNNTVNNIELIKSNEVIAWTWSFSDLLDHENGFVEVLADYKQEPLSFYLLKHPYRDDKNLTVFAEFIEKIFQESRELGDTNII